MLERESLSRISSSRSLGDTSHEEADPLTRRLLGIQNADNPALVHHGDTIAERKDFVELFPLPTGPKDLHRLKRLWRYNAYTRYYPNDAATREYLESGIRFVYLQAALP